MRLDMDEYDEAEEAAERMGELKLDISKALRDVGVHADPFMLERDIYVGGALSNIVKVYLEWRSEIDEELG